MISISPKQKRILAYVTFLAIFLGGYFLKNYLMLIIVATIVALVFNPLYKKLLDRGNKPGKAATLTLVATFLVVIIPTAIILIISAFQLKGLVDSIGNSAQNTNLNDLLQSFVNYTNNLLSSVGISHQLSLSSIQAQLGQSLTTLSENILGGLSAFLGSIGGIISTAIIYIYVFMAILINQEKLLETFYLLNPLGRDISELYAKRAGIMTKAMVRGQFIIATVQGITDALLLYLAGFHSGFVFYAILLIVLSIIPLGGGIIVIPIGIVMLLTGQIWQGVLLLAGHLLIVTNEDNVLRPKLVPDEARLDPALTLLSVFSGLAFFGFIGIVLGPVIMILIVTTIEVYLEAFKNISRSNKSTPKKHRNLLSKLKFWDSQART